MGFLMNELGLSERRSCRIVGLSRSVQQYRPCARRRRGRRTDAGAGLGEPPLRLSPAARDAAAGGAGREPQADLPALSREGLQVRTKKRRKLPRRDRIAPQVPQRPMQRWSLDFVSDQLADCRRFRVLNIVDDHSRFCPGQIVDVSISGARVARHLDDLAGARPARGDRPRQRSGGHQPRHVRLVGAHRRPAALHRAGQAGPERLRREPERQAPRRVPEPALVPLAAPCPRGDRTMAPPLQHRAPPFGARLPHSDGGPHHQRRSSACSQTSERQGEEISGPPPQPTLPAVRQAIIGYLTAPPPKRCPHCFRPLSRRPTNPPK